MSITIQAAIELYGGGPGSGCKGENCGRPPGKDEAKQERARASFVPVTTEKILGSAANVRQIADVIGGKATPDNHPFDVLKGKVGIEVKTIYDTAKKDKVTVHRESRLRKEEYAKRSGLKSMYVVAVDQRKGKENVYYAKVPGWSFRLRNMEPVGSISNLKGKLK